MREFRTATLRLSILSLSNLLAVYRPVQKLVLTEQDETTIHHGGTKR